MKRHIALLLAALFGITLTFIAIDAMTNTAGAVTGGGVFSLNCKFSHANNDDPIIFPGQPGAAHFHGFVGARTTNAHSTVDSMRAGGTTCPVAQDTAGYWFPLLVSPSGVTLMPHAANLYYRSPVGKAVQPFPADLRIVAGGDTLNPPAPWMAQRSLSWACSDSGPFYPGPVDCGSRSLIAHVLFPVCLAVGDTDSADHRSHMAYGKSCAPGLVPVPRLSFHIRYNVPGTNDAAYRLSSDTAEGGRSLHADFWNTWDQPTLECLTDRVLNAGLSAKKLTTARVASLGC